MGDKRARAEVGRILVSALIVTFIASALSISQMCAADNTTAISEPLAAKADGSAEKPQEALPPAAVKVEDAAGQAQLQAQEEVNAAEAVPVDPGNITVNFKGADIKTVLAYISETAGVDIVSAPDVSGTVDLRLNNKPWKTALDIIVRNNGFAYEREGDVIRVVTIAKLKQEELVTQAFNLNYSKTREVSDAVKNILTERGKVVYDDRTNTVLVTDIPTNLYKIGEVISRLDKITQQVLIEAMVIETRLGDDERMGINWNVQIAASGAARPTTMPFNAFNDDEWKALGKMIPFSQTGAPSVAYDAAGNMAMVDPGDFPASQAGMLPKNFPFAIASQFTFGTLDFSSFSAVLEMLKRRADSELIANPRILTMNNQEADIHVGLNIVLPKFERNSTTGKMEITGWTIEVETDPKTGKQTTKGLKTGVTLKVTPHINDKMEIYMDLEPSISDEPEFRSVDPAGNVVALIINERVAKTQARINDGETIFIGGLIHEQDEIVNNKLPILGDILGDVPYVGLLFSHKDSRKVKRELIFFVTVHIVKPGEKIAGSPVPDNAAKARYTMTQNESKNSKPSKKKPWNKGFLNSEK